MTFDAVKGNQRGLQDLFRRPDNLIARIVDFFSVVERVERQDTPHSNHSN